MLLAYAMCGSATDFFFRPPVRVGPQALSALNTSVLDHCHQLLSRRWPQAYPAPHSAPITLLAYATKIPSKWLLGVSAARHRLPLVIAGLGEQSDWVWWEGAAAKLSGSARALQVLERLAPNTPVALVDGFDTIVANPPNVLRLQDVARAGTVYLGGECNSCKLAHRGVWRRASSSKSTRVGGTPYIWTL